MTFEAKATRALQTIASFSLDGEMADGEIYHMSCADARGTVQMAVKIARETIRTLRKKKKCKT